MRINNTFVSRSSGVLVELPLFIPVYRPDHTFELFNEDTLRYGLSAVMVNAFLLFRDRGPDNIFRQGLTLREHIGGFRGMLCTDSGAFQQLGGRKVDIDPLEIVKFQNLIKADIAAPLDLITPPDTSYEETERRMVISQYRIEEALEASEYADLAGIQQGGGYFDLRQKHIRLLADIGVKYFGIGSMVPFFNRNHDLAFTCGVVRDARSVIGQKAPMHIYGAGDPLDIAFMFAAGANVFDSSSYAHYAQRGFYMTPFGAVSKRTALDKLGFECNCPVCSSHAPGGMFDHSGGEPLRKQHNLFMILETVKKLRELSSQGCVGKYLADVFDAHTANADLFPGSMLARSWERFLEGGAPESAATDAPVSVAVDGGADAGGDPDGPSPIERDLIAHLAGECSVTYKMDRARIEKLIAGELREPRQANFRDRLKTADSFSEARRTGEFKTFRKTVRTAVYRELRRYKADGGTNELLSALISCSPKETPAAVDRLLEAHISTAERLPHRGEFVESIRKEIERGGVVVDIGCGFAPLLFPEDFYRDLSRYIAVDKDSTSTELVRIFAKKLGIGNLEAYTWDISSGPAALNAMTGVDLYGAALMLKVIPVIYRADRAQGIDSRMTGILGSFPAGKLVVSVNRESMTKRESIEKRELGALRRFVDEYGLEVVSEFSCGDEAGFSLRWVGYELKSSSYPTHL